MNGPTADILTLVITLVCVALLIGFVMNLVSFGSTQLSIYTRLIQNQLSAAQDMTIDSYNNQVRGGQEVENCFRTYGTDYAIVVKNKALIKAGCDSDIALNYGCLLKGADQTSNTSLLTNPDDPDNDTVYEIKVSESEDDDCIFKRSGTAVFGGNLALDGGMTLHNENIIGFSTRGIPQFLRSSAKYQAYLIKDNNDDVVGFYFEQIS